MPDTFGEGSGSDVYLSDLSERDKPWDAHRTNVSIVSGLYEEAGLENRALRMSLCANHLTFGCETSEDGQRRFRLKSTHFCRQRLCPMCQWRRTRKWIGKFFEAIPKILQDYPKYRWLSLTLTVRNPPMDRLRETVIAMNKSFNLMTKYKAYPAVGWVKSLEVTKSKDEGTPHPHFHCLLMVPSSYFKSGRYLKQEKWEEMWSKAAKLDYYVQVNVQAVKPSRENVEITQDSHPLKKAVLETFKYGIKEPHLINDPQWLEDLTYQMHKIRCVSVGGVLKQYFKKDDFDENKTEDLIHAEEDGSISEEKLEKLPEWFFDWEQKVTRYKKDNNR